MTRNGQYWSNLQERGVDWGPAALGLIYRVFGRRVCMAVLAPVIAYFYLSGRVQRLASRDYLRRIWQIKALPGRPGHWHSLKHFYVFGIAMLDKLASWIGEVRRESIDGIDGADINGMRNDPRGALILSAHVGNVEIVRAIAARHQKRRINVIIHTAQAANFNRLIERFAPESAVRLIPAAEIGVATAMFLSAAIERGEWVVIMGDRTPVHGQGRTLTVPFLGAPAQFPQGPFQLVNTLRCQTYMMVCLKQAGRYRIHFSQFSPVNPPELGDRRAALQTHADKFARALEGIVLTAPYQWFNFYDYWGHKHN